MLRFLLTRLLLLVVAVAAALVAAGISGAAYYKPHEVKAQPYVPGELIVRGLSGRFRAGQTSHDNPT